MTTSSRRHFFLLLVCALGCARAVARMPPTGDASRPGHEPEHARPRALAVDVHGDLLYVALSTGNRLAVVDVSQGRARVVAELPMCAFPDALAPLPAGGVVVACRFDPGLRVVTRAKGLPPSTPIGAPTPAHFQVRIVDAGPEHGHQGIAIDPSGRFAYVASPPRGGVKIVGLEEGASPSRFMPTGLFPRALRVVTPRGDNATGATTLLLVSNFVGHTVTIHKVLNDGGLSAPLQTITTEAPVLDLAIALPPSPPPLPPQPRHPSLPAAAARGAQGPDGALLLLTHEDRVLSREHLAVEGLDSVLLSLPRTPPGQPSLFVDPGPGKRRAFNLTERTLPEHDATKPSPANPGNQPLVGLDAIAVGPAGDRVAIVGAGSDNVLIGPPDGERLLAIPATTVGAHPSAVVFLADGRVVTADRLSDTLSFIRTPVARAALPAPSPTSPAAGSDAEVVTVTVGNPQRRTDAERGEVLFYSRALVPNNVATGALSLYTCAACHADGQIDGRRHPSKRNRFFSMTKTCRGLAGTEPFLSVGKPNTFAAFADNIVATHAQGALDAPRTFDRYPVTLRLREGDAWTTVTLSPEQMRAALAAYMSRIPLEPSPFVAPGRRQLTAPERRGLATFRDNCAGCHQLFRSTRDARAIPAGEIEARLLAGQVALTSALLYDVGTPVLGEGGNNPPSLRSVWAAAPYFSDGSAPTLEDLLNRTNPHAAKIHAAENARHPPAFSAAARDDLLSFLRAL